MSMTDIAAVSGMSKAAVYRYFPTKQAVIRELATRELDEDRRLVEQLLGAGVSDPEPVLATALRAYCEEMVADPFIVQLSAAVRADVELARLDQGENQRFAERIARALEPDASREVLAALELRLRLVFGLLDGLIQVASAVEPEQVGELIDSFVEMSVRTIFEPCR